MPPHSRTGRPLARAGALVVAVLALVGATLLTPAGGQLETGAASPAAAAPAANRPPHIVVVMTDDMRVDDLRYAPQVRRLVAENGITFANSFSPYPLCCPARASFLTGTYAHNHRVFWHDPPYGYGAFDDSRTLATSLSAAGYRTGFVGKYLNRYGTARSKVSGQPSWRYVPRGWSDWRAAVENPGNAGFHGGTYHYTDTPFNVNGRIDNRYRGRYNTDVIGDFSVDMARRFAASSKPFFMYVNYVAPHFGGPRDPDDPGPVRDANGLRREFKTPYVPPQYRGRFDRLITRPRGMPRGGGPSEKDVSDQPRFVAVQPEPNRAELRAMTESSRQRAESIFAVDRQVARLVGQLKKSGAWSRTVFMFTSDNGFFAGEHRLRSGKVHSYEPSLRVPLVVTGPGMRGRAARGDVRYDPITTIDVSATILDLAAAKPPRPADGASRLRTMREGDQGWTAPVLMESSHGLKGKRKGFDDARSGIGVRTARYSATLYRNWDSTLFDLRTDPLENTNRWDDPAYRTVRAQLLEVWRARKDCRGRSCQVALPPELRASADQAAWWTRGYWKTIGETYGH